jgi:hypothetical protein
VKTVAGTDAELTRTTGLNRRLSGPSGGLQYQCHVLFCPRTQAAPIDVVTFHIPESGADLVVEVREQPGELERSIRRCDRRANTFGLVPQFHDSALRRLSTGKQYLARKMPDGLAGRQRRQNCCEPGTENTPHAVSWPTKLRMPAAFE